MTQKNRITYRFDRNGQSVNEASRTNDKHQEAPNHKEASTSIQNNDANKSTPKNVIPLYPSTDQHAVSEVSPWNSPFQEDIGALEQMIRNTDANPVPPATIQSTPQKEKIKSAKPIVMDFPQQQYEHQKINEESYFDYDDMQEPLETYEDDLIDDEAANKRNQYRYSQSKSKARTPSWFNVFLSVTAALATGALFGYLLLSLFTGASIWPGGTADKPESQPVIKETTNSESGNGSNVNVSKGSQEGAIENNNNNTAKPNPNIAMVELSGLDRIYYLLQFGVFSNTEGRDAAMEQLAGKGLAGAAMTSAADYRVYVGMGSDRNQAQVIRDLLPNTDLYIKEVSIVNPGKMPFKGDQKLAQSFFEQTGVLVQMLGELTIAQLEQPTLSALSEVATDSWATQHQKWTENAATLRIGIEDADGKAYLDKMIKAMNTAAKSMVEYNKKPSQAHLWSAQGEVMKVVIAQKEWFEKISAL